MAPTADQPLTESQIELAKSLPDPEIPKNWRCARCQKLALDAYKLPCCDKPICATCVPLLIDKCPQCSHSPLSADSCLPNRAVRRSIRVLLTKKEKKIEASKKAEEAAAVTAVQTADSPPAADSIDNALPSVEVSAEKKDDTSLAEARSMEDFQNAAQSTADQAGEVGSGTANFSFSVANNL
ncbi:hypothetical protein GQ43DRAFT_21197 [Delitschia confertaspora ATCC 74209]|uniref:RING-type domain-containing protein n=1 Tax=Delitschia confertaspora ATCC 74209 TaxID=1513339 RepID=A0A9P4MT79_9PLEO|nr:hypothetical protein GQ43DRAFT_21197 [Delitschia confertaspora ATCC 74209]